jgi:hypothetical protein
VVPDWVKSRIKSYVLSRESGRKEDVVKVILGEYEVGWEKAWNIVENVLEDLWWKGKVRLPYKEQIGAPYIWETIG